MELPVTLAANSPASASVYSDFAGLQRLKLQSRDDPGAALREVAGQFEALFMAQMLKAMRATLPADGMFSGGDMQTYQDMFDQQLTLDLARGKGLGLAAQIERQLAMAQRYTDTPAAGGDAAAAE